MLQTHNSALVGFVDALVARNFERLQEMLSPNVFFRALVPPGARHANTASAAVKSFRDWFGDADRCELLKSEFDTIGDLEQASYRLRLREGGVWYLCEQHVNAKVGPDGIEVLDLMCSGFRRESPAGS